jgi:hypothetical protein
MLREALCPTCARFNEEFVEIMREHLRAERELYESAILAKDSVAAHQINTRILKIMEASKQLRMRFESHRLKEHSADLPDLETAFDL